LVRSQLSARGRLGVVWWGTWDVMHLTPHPETDGG
jgi:hypothetical protein